MYANRGNFRFLKEIGIEEHGNDGRFETGSGNTTVSRMRNEKFAIQPLFMAALSKFSSV